MLKTSKIDNLFGTSLKMTTCTIPKEILHPQIESDIIAQYGDSIQSAWIIRVYDTQTQVFVSYNCVIGTSGNMYRVEYIEVSTAYMAGYGSGIQGLDITLNPYGTTTVIGEINHNEWIKGYHEGYKHSLTPNTVV